MKQKKTADNAKSVANTANTNANNALNEIEALKELTRIEVTYNDSSETITITTGTHV